MGCVSYKHRGCALRSSRGKAEQGSKLRAGVGNRGQAEGGSEEGAAPREQDLGYSCAPYGQQQGGEEKGTAALRRQQSQFVLEKAVSKLLGPSLDLQVCEFGHQGPEFQRGPSG